jgi:hypothetical protein
MLIESLLLEIARAKFYYKENNASEDDSGDGLDTFDEVLEDLLTLQKKLGQPRNYSLDALQSMDFSNASI